MSVRIDIAKTIADDFLPAKREAHAAASASYAALATLLSQQLRARLQPGEGDDILRHLRSAADRQLEAVFDIHAAHAGLAVFRRAYAIPASAIGPDDTPETGGAGERHLVAVA
jgi:hypothetical protein